MLRTFIPVGQGAFYKEKFDDFTIVYDCGTLKDNDFIKKIIKNNFNKDEVIDILFISHFHKDHISGIQFLKEHCNIKNVVLPYLHENEITALALESYLTDSDDDFEYLTDFLNYEFFFGEEDINVIFFGENSSEDFEENPESVIDVDSRIRSINRGQRISSSKVRDWFFVPFNRNNKINLNTFKTILNREGLNPSEIKEILKNKKIDKQKYREIKKLFNEVSKRDNHIHKKLNAMINYNSMMVYSGPINPSYRLINDFMRPEYCYYHSRYFRYYRGYFEDFRYRVGCIYTGDSNLENDILSVAYGKYSDFVGTIQIPHHGSKENFNQSLFNLDFCFCPMSFGTDNPYNHPSGLVVAELFENYKLPIFITEKTDSVYIQNIRER